MLGRFVYRIAGKESEFQDFRFRRLQCEDNGNVCIASPASQKKHESKNFQLTHRIAFNEPSTLFVFTSHFDLVFFSTAEEKLSLVLCATANIEYRVTVFTLYEMLCFRDFVIGEKDFFDVMSKVFSNSSFFPTF